MRNRGTDRYGSRLDSGAAGGPRIAPGRTTITASLPPPAPRDPAGAPRAPGGTRELDLGRATPMAMPRGGGESLPSGVAGSMGEAFGADLSPVRLHRDSASATAAGAVAFTAGLDVHFAPGRFDADSVGGREVIGHELAHVVQQSQGRTTAPIQTFGAVIDVDAGLEREADDLGRRAARGERVMSAGTLTAPSAPVMQCMRHEELAEGRYYLVSYEGNLLPARLVRSKPGAYELVVVGSASIIHIENPDDFVEETKSKKKGKGTKGGDEDHHDEDDRDKGGGGSKDVEPTGKRPDGPPVSKRGRMGGGNGSRRGGGGSRGGGGRRARVAEAPTAVVMLDPDDGAPVAIVPEELIAAYRQDVATERAHHLQEPEGQLMAADLGVTALVMNQVAGPLIQSNFLVYGNGGGTQGILLHIGGNHYIVLERAHPDALDVDFIDLNGDGYVEIMPTVRDGNCLVDGLYIIARGEPAPADEIARLRGVASAGLTREQIEQVLSAIIVAIARGEEPGGIGPLTRRYIARDTSLPRIRDELAVKARASRRKQEKPEPKAEKAPSIPSGDSPSDVSVRSSKRAKLEKRDQPSVGEVLPSSKSPAKPSSGQSGDHALEDAVTRYVLEANRLGEPAARETEAYRAVAELWPLQSKEALPDARGLAAWISERESVAHDYFGSDTESEADENFQPPEDDLEESSDKFTPEDEELLASLNEAIRAAETSADIEKILTDKAFERFVVPQYRGIAYMTNRFSKAKRREHRRASQVGKPVFADAVRPPEMPREQFYTTSHGADGDVAKNARLFRAWLARKRRPDPFVDPTRKAKTGTSRVFPTPFHLLQSDYSENYSKSAKTVSDYHELGGKPRPSASDDPDPARDKVYGDVPFRSHPFVSTADEPRHAVRYALGNKPIAAEKPFRLRPRWRSSGKAQHPYSGKVYASFHPLRDYLSPNAPSHVWSGRTLGALAINDHTSKEGESSFLAVLKRHRVVIEQVIRWPSLVADKDKSLEFGLTAEERAEFREILATHAPHSPEQQAMKTDTLGPRVEAFFTRLLERRVRAEAVRRKKKIIYRDLKGTFSSTPPKYKTPSTTASKMWGAPKLDPTAAELRKKILVGEQPIGGKTEGYFGDWPADDFYAGLSDEEADDEAESESSQREPRRVDPVREAMRTPEIATFVNASRLIVAGTQRGLGAVAARRGVDHHLPGALALARKLAQRAYFKVYLGALPGAGQDDPFGRDASNLPSQLLRVDASPGGGEGAVRDWLRAQIAAIVESLHHEIGALAMSWEIGGADGGGYDGRDDFDDRGDDDFDDRGGGGSGGFGGSRDADDRGDDDFDDRGGGGGGFDLGGFGGGSSFGGGTKLDGSMPASFGLGGHSTISASAKPFEPEAETSGYFDSLAAAVASWPLVPESAPPQSDQRDSSGPESMELDLPRPSLPEPERPDRADEPMPQHQEHEADGDDMVT